MRKLMAGEEEWDIALANGERTVAWYNPCCFAIATWDWYTIYIGGKDIADLARDSINMLVSNSLVGAHGDQPSKMADNLQSLALHFLAQVHHIWPIATKRVNDNLS
jgi:hypothetical protein